MARITKIELETAREEVKQTVAEHLSQGYKISNEKLTLLHNITAFKALEESSYTLDKELQRLIGKRAGDFFEYAISVQNDCLVCNSYFTKLLEENGINVDTFEFTERENLLIAYGRAMAENPKQIPEELFTQLKKEFTEEEIVVITTMGALMIANNYFNDILQVEP